MADPPPTELKTVRLSVADFWDLYAEADLLTLKRDPDRGYTGTYYVDENGEPAVFLGEEKQFTLTRDELLKYRYKDEPLFELGVCDDLAAALAMLVAMPIMRNDTAPNRAQLGLVLELLDQDEPGADVAYRAVWQQTSAALEDGDISLEDAAELMEDLLPDQEDYDAYEATGAVTMLNAEREILLKAYAFCPTDSAITEQITAVINNHEREDVITVQTAIWALGRHNDKAALDTLYNLLGNEELDFHSLTIQDALQYLASGRELVPTTGEDERGYWSKQRRQLPKDPAAWAAHDAGSIFWEKRLRVASGWKASGEETRLDRLKKDEILPVRLAAGGPGKFEAEDSP